MEISQLRASVRLSSATACLSVTQTPFNQQITQFAKGIKINKLFKLRYVPLKGASVSKAKEKFELRNFFGNF